MNLARMTSYNTIGEDQRIIDRPLFGQPTIWEKIGNWLSIGTTGALVLITSLGAIIKSNSDAVHKKGFDVYFAICLIMLCASHYVLVYWYRQGDVDPKFRYLIYSNTLLIILLNICAHLYIYAL